MEQIAQENKRNWSDYNKKLVRNGRINFWFDEELLQNWFDNQKTSKKRGRPNTYGNDAIAFCHIIRHVYKLPLRQAEGMVNSILNLAKSGLRSPCYTQISRRSPDLEKIIKDKLSKADEGGVTHVLFDSTGLKIYGEGEWKVRKYGYSKRRTWRKLHIAINADTQKILSCELTNNDIDDAETAHDMIDELPKSVKIVSGDGGYDDAKIYNKLQELGIKSVIPPDKNAVISSNARCKKNHGIAQRDEVLLKIQRNMLIGGMSLDEARKKWKIESNYHQRSKVETSFYRLKTCLGDKLSSRKFENQKIEAAVKCMILNKFST